MVAKRPASSAATLAKRQKRDPILDKCDAVAKGLQSADLPDIVEKMLTDMLSSSLGIFMDERHKYQSSVVNMVADVLSGAEAGLKQNIEEAEAQVSKGATEQAAREAAVQEAEATLQAKASETKERKLVLAGAATAFKEAKEGVAAALAAQKAGDKDILEAGNKKATLETAMTDFVKPLTEGGLSEDQAKEAVASLTAVLKKFDFDQSMIMSIPTSLSKEPAVRGPFDTMVVAQLDEEVGKRVAALDATLKEGEPSKAERAAALASAEATLVSAKEAQLASAESFQAAQKAEKDASAALDAAKKALKAMTSEIRSHNRALDIASAELSVFQEGPLAVFGELKEHVAPPPPPEEPEAAPEEAAPEAAAEEEAAPMEAEAPAEAEAEAPVGEAA